MKLIYINKLGEDWTGKDVYEFLFSDEIKNVDGDDWDMYPASGRPSPPHEHFVKVVGKLTTGELTLKLVQDSTEFAVWDAVDGVVSLAWEDIQEYNTYPEYRLAFQFGEEIKDVEEKLYRYDLVLIYNNEYKNIENEN